MLLFIYLPIYIIYYLFIFYYLLFIYLVIIYLFFQLRALVCFYLSYQEESLEQLITLVQTQYPFRFRRLLGNLHADSTSILEIAQVSSDIWT